jgi:hypothetical protein
MLERPPEFVREELLAKNVVELLAKEAERFLVQRMPRAERLVPDIELGFATLTGGLAARIPKHS